MKEEVVEVEGCGGAIARRVWRACGRGVAEGGRPAWGDGKAAPQATQAWPRYTLRARYSSSRPAPAACTRAGRPRATPASDLGPGGARRAARIL